MTDALQGDEKRFIVHAGGTADGSTRTARICNVAPMTNMPLSHAHSE